MGDKFANRTLVAQVTLPSRGLLYGGRIPEGRLEVAGITLDEEMRMAGKTGMAKAEVLFRACVDYGEGEPPDLLMGDRHFLWAMIQAVTYGYGMRWSDLCPNQRCGARNTHAIDVRKVPSRALTENDLEPFVVDLPVRKIRIGLRHARASHEAQVAEYVEKFMGGGRGMDPAIDPTHAPKIAVSIATIGDKIVDMSSALAFIMSPPMASADLRAIERALNEHACGLDLTIPVKCEKCGTGYATEVPLTGEHFRIDDVPEVVVGAAG